MKHLTACIFVVLGFLHFNTCVVAQVPAPAPYTTHCEANGKQFTNSVSFPFLPVCTHTCTFQLPSGTTANGGDNVANWTMVCADGSTGSPWMLAWTQNPIAVVGVRICHLSNESSVAGSTFVGNGFWPDVTASLGSDPCPQQGVWNAPLGSGMPFPGTTNNNGAHIDLHNQAVAGSSPQYRVDLYYLPSPDTSISGGFTLVSAPGMVPEVYQLVASGVGQAALPADFNPAQNQIDVYGASGATDPGNNGYNAPGAGGGEWARKNNVNLTAGATVYYNIGAPGIGNNTIGDSTAGGDTWVCTASPCTEASAIVRAHGGQPGISSTPGGGGTPGNGGQCVSGDGDVCFSGGPGSPAVGGSNSGAGGGCAGPNGAGGAAGGSAGGTGNGGTVPGGVGGTPASPGVAGNYYGTSPPVGPGSGAGAPTGVGTAQAGGLFCGAPSGAREFGGPGTNGEPGLVVILNWPVT